MVNYEVAWEVAEKEARLTANHMYPEGHREKDREDAYHRIVIDKYLAMVTPPRRYCQCCGKTIKCNPR